MTLYKKACLIGLNKQGICTMQWQAVINFHKVVLQERFTEVVMGSAMN